MRVGIYGSNADAAAMVDGFSAYGVLATARNHQFYRGEVETFELVVVIGANNSVRDSYEKAGIRVIAVADGELTAEQMASAECARRLLEPPGPIVENLDEGTNSVGQQLVFSGSSLASHPHEHNDNQGAEFAAEQKRRGRPPKEK